MSASGAAATRACAGTAIVTDMDARAADKAAADARYHLCVSRSMQGADSLRYVCTLTPHLLEQDVL